jgi:FkbM family methyltransferase
VTRLYWPRNAPGYPAGGPRIEDATRRSLWEMIRRDAPSTTLHKLKPAKVRSAAHRRWFEARMQRQAFVPRDDLADVGTTYGGWILPMDLVQAGDTCYSIGAGGDVSFDLELVRSYGVAVRSVEPVGSYVEEVRASAGDLPGFIAYEAALALEDGPIRMQQSHWADSRSVSAANIYEGDEWVEVAGRTLESLMAESGDSRVDLLKVDIEGVEYEWLRHVDLVALGVKVLSIQLHHNESLRTARAAIRGLADAGFHPVACRPVIKLTFVREVSEPASP